MIEKTVSDFLTYLKIPVSKSYCERIIKSHEYYPSLLSVVDALDQLGIRNIAGTVNASDLNKLSFPYLIQLKTGKANITAIEGIKDLDAIKSEYDKWNGVVLQIEPTTSITDSENNNYYSKERVYSAIRSILGIQVVLFILFLLLNTHSPLILFTLFTSLVGVVTGYVLIAKDLGIKYSIVENFCTYEKDNDCDKVLNSPGAKLFFDIKLADLVFSFFIFQTSCILASLLLPGLSSSIFAFLWLQSIVLIPVVFASIYYQYFVAKAWCRLCLIINVILVAQSLVLLYASIKGLLGWINLNIATAFWETLAFLTIGCVVILVKNLAEERKTADEELVRALRIKNNVNVFKSLLAEQKKCDMTLMEHEILLGKNPNAPVRLIIVSNLFCNPCRSQHEELCKLINLFPDKICAAIRFVDNADAGEYLIQYWLENIHQMKDEYLNTEKIIHDWYSMMNLEKFRKRFPLKSGNSSSCQIMLEQHKTFVKKFEVSQTPAFFINGNEMPRNYQLMDIAPLIAALSEEGKLVYNDRELSAV